MVVAYVNGHLFTAIILQLTKNIDIRLLSKVSGHCAEFAY